MKIQELFEGITEAYKVEPAARKPFDERRMYIVDKDMEPMDSFMSTEVATRAIKNSPKKYIKGEYQIKTGKALNVHFNIDNNNNKQD